MQAYTHTGLINTHTLSLSPSLSVPGTGKKCLFMDITTSDLCFQLRKP